MNGIGGDIVVRPAVWPEDIAPATSLLRSYQDFLLNNPASVVRICVTDYDRELAALPTVWVGNDAVLLLAWRNEEAIGCVGVHMLMNRPHAAEMKRMWIVPTARGMGLGRRLMQAAIDWSRDHTARELLLDTAPDAMPEARHLYGRMGFEPCQRYNSNPVPGIVFLRLPLG